MKQQMADQENKELKVAQCLSQEAEAGNLERVIELLKLNDLGFEVVATQLPQLIRAFKKGHFKCVAMVIRHVEKNSMDTDVLNVACFLLILSARARNSACTREMAVLIKAEERRQLIEAETISKKAAESVCKEAEEGNLQNVRCSNWGRIGFGHIVPFLSRLVRAFENGHIECVRFIFCQLAQKEWDPKDVGPLLLSCAVCNRRKDCIKYLIQLGVNPYATENVFAWVRLRSNSARQYVESKELGDLMRPE